MVKKDFLEEEKTKDLRNDSYAGEEKKGRG